VGACTFSQKLNVTPDDYVGTSMAVIEVTPSGSYATGGDTLDLNAGPDALQLGGEPYLLQPDGNPQGYLIQIVYQSSPVVRVRFFTAPGAEVPAGTPVAALVFRAHLVAPFSV
jgi:hypothetical protein